MEKQRVAPWLQPLKGDPWYLVGEPPPGEDLEGLPVYEELSDIPVMRPEDRLWYHPEADTR